VSIRGLTVGLTGRLEGLTRSEFKALLTRHGATYSARIDDDVDLVIAGEGALTSKVSAARSHSAEVLSLQALNARLEAPIAPANALLEAVRPPTLQLTGSERAPPAIQRLQSSLRVLDVAIPLVKPGPMTPSKTLFSHYCLDARTLQMMRFVTRAVQLSHPCLLEGDTATSKTSVIQYLAALSGHQVVRLNLNGQSDTSELVGRYVPTDRETGPAWRFQEGLVPQAMRHGWWVILDEVNLAEPAVLERLNSVLERSPTLVLTEGTGTQFGPGADVAVHPNFRIFATMNPAEYQGRSVLSPAYKDRWIATFHATSPDELHYRQMLERLVYGRQPDVLVGGMAYAGSVDDAPSHSTIRDVSGADELLSRLAALHAGLVSMSTAADGRSASLGASRRERYVFSRRALLGVLDALHLGALCDPHTGQEHTFADAPSAVAVDSIYRIYVDRMRDPEDRARVLKLLETLGLRRETWTLDLGN
jgi:MoxR-like ATPase